MSNGFILILMLFFHVLDDYGMQGILASMKQKEWWKQNAPSAFYKYDYIVALIMHSISWTFMIMLPIAISYSFYPPESFYIMFGFNVVIHMLIDDLKANRKLINLVGDQSVHIAQILFTVSLFWR